MTDDAWGPMPLRWRHARVGDVIVTGAGQTRALWVLTQVETFGRTTRTAAVSGTRRHQAEVDPDAVITVLVPLVEREAIRAAREVLGAAVAGRG